jgi:RNA polymerase sigma-70 factor (ECF subfamily)
MSDKDNPKRKKAKDNPYTIYYSRDKQSCFLSFTDGQGKNHRFEISKSLYELFDEFELDDLSALNEFDRHAEHSELTEGTLNERAFIVPKSVEEIVYEHIQSEQLHNAISKLPEVQRRRLTLYYFAELTYEQIAEMEGCTIMPVKRSVDTAIKKLKIFLK